MHTDKIKMKKYLSKYIPSPFHNEVVWMRVSFPFCRFFSLTLYISLLIFPFYFSRYSSEDDSPFRMMIITIISDPSTKRYLFSLYFQVSPTAVLCGVLMLPTSLPGQGSSVSSFLFYNA